MRTRTAIAIAALAAALTGCGTETDASQPAETSNAAKTTVKAALENWDTVKGLTAPTMKDIEFLNQLNADDPRWNGETGQELTYHVKGDKTCGESLDDLVANHAGAKRIIPNPVDRRDYFRVAQAVYC